VFSKNCPTIVIKDISSGKTASKLLNPKTSSSSTVPELTDDEQTQLNEGININFLLTVNYGLFLLTFFTYWSLLELSKREKSTLFHCNTHNEIRVHGKVVKWPWRIKCGICSNNIQLRFDADLKGRVSAFDRRKLFI
jgi:hypothetical protein